MTITLENMQLSMPPSKIMKQLKGTSEYWLFDGYFPLKGNQRRHSWIRKYYCASIERMTLVNPPPNLASSHLPKHVKGTTTSRLFVEFSHLKKHWRHSWLRKYFCTAIEWLTLVGPPPNPAPSCIIKRVKSTAASRLFYEFSDLKKHWGQFLDTKIFLYRS